MGIDEERKIIDRIDEQIIKLLISRFEIVESIQDFKQRLSLEIHQPSREQEILKLLEGKKYSEHLKKIFKKIMEESKKHQSK